MLARRRGGAEQDRTRLTTNRLFTSLKPGGVAMNAPAKPKARKVTAKPRPHFDLKTVTDDISKRFSETLKYLAR